MEEYDADAFSAGVRANQHGTVLATQRAIPLPKESEAGAIITMSALAGRFGYPNRVAL